MTQPHHRSTRAAIFVFAILTVVITFNSTQSTHAAERNIILFITDDQSPDTGAYGNPVIQTPHMDALAADGTLFTHAFATTASCSASRSVILTGLHNHANGQFGHQHDFHKFSSFPNVKSLPVLLEAAGYRTARIGKYHVAPESVYRFQHALPGNSRHPVQMADNARAFIAGDDDADADETNADRPFFLLFATSDPHRGGGFAEELPHKPDRFGNLPDNAARPNLKAVTYSPDDVIVPPFLPDNPTTRAELAQYYQSVSRVDQGLGRLIQHLKETNQYDNTLILFISDHGIAFPGAKTTVYEPGLRSPAIIRNPYESNRGVIQSAMISWVDLTPTILDFAGVYNNATQSIPADIAVREGQIGTDRQWRDPDNNNQPRPYTFHGRSFLQLLDGRDPGDPWNTIYASHTFHEIQMYYPMRVFRTRNHKLIWNIAHPLPFPFASDLWIAPTWQRQYGLGPDAPYGQRTVGQYLQHPEFELFDLSADPHESNNLADSPDHAQLLNEMKQKLRDFQQRTNDPWILKWEYE